MGSRRAGRVRSTLVAACGVAALAGTTTTAAAVGQDGLGSPQLPAHALDGLPLPDRVTDGPRRTADQADAVVRVRPGDSLWAIAARRLGPAADVADVATYWRRIHDLNAAVIGPDPDLVQPGQHLRLPHI
ncbi:LysM peptidoglycan-binding domain-containing protein [Nocardioides sp.]|nr:LysM peptidoglycan-binding domain-containing protein [Nocardioides sp.]